jgi:hypothetical protein
MFLPLLKEQQGAAHPLHGAIPSPLPSQPTPAAGIAPALLIAVGAGGGGVQRHAGAPQGEAPDGGAREGGALEERGGTKGVERKPWETRDRE